MYKQLILTGDFNGVVDLNKDKQMQNKNRRKQKGKLSLIFHELTKLENLCDIWHNKNPMAKDYTFYSNRHATFSRIDMMWATSRLFGLTKKKKK